MFEENTENVTPFKGCSMRSQVELHIFLREDNVLAVCFFIWYMDYYLYILIHGGQKESP